MIDIVKGNILNAKEDVICHQVNCMGVMGSGLAKQIRDKYPEAYKEYKDFCKNSRFLLGNMCPVSCKDGKIVVHLFGQYYYGRDKQYTDYKALESALCEMYCMMRAFKKSIAIPYNLGCGLAGGDWNEVYKIIEKVFEDYNVAIYKLV